MVRLFTIEDCLCPIMSRDIDSSIIWLIRHYFQRNGNMVSLQWWATNLKTVELQQFICWKRRKITVTNTLKFSSIILFFVSNNCGKFNINRTSKLYLVMTFDYTTNMRACLHLNTYSGICRNLDKFANLHNFTFKHGTGIWSNESFWLLFVMSDRLCAA